MSTQCWIGTRKGLIQARRHADDSWSLSPPSFPGDPVTMVLPADDGGITYAALNLGHFGPKLHRSEDGGKSWQECKAPAFPAQDKAGDESSNNAKSVELIWILEHGANGDLWAGTVPAALFRSRDRGENWEYMESLNSVPGHEEWFGGGFDEPGIHSISIDPRDPRHLIVALSCGGVWQSHDNGASWNSMAQGMRAEYVPPADASNPNIQDPHRLLACPAHPERLWVQHHNGIFRFDEADGVWIEIENVKPAVFGFALAVHPWNPDIAWFVPAVRDDCRMPVDNQLVVNRTLDGGASFESLRAGLPQTHSYDLIYRHSLDVASDGQALMMGSTSGNLWFSKNGGEKWESLAANLAKIYCVKFGQI